MRKILDKFVNYVVGCLPQRKAPSPSWEPPPLRPTGHSPERRAAEARSILDNPLFIEACQKVEDRFREARRRVPMADATMHTRLILAEQSWLQVRGFFVETLMTGEELKRQMLQAEQERSLMQQRFSRGIRN